jgi:hypothetical protein
MNIAGLWEGVLASVAPAAASLDATFATALGSGWWWTVALSVALTLRACTVFGRGVRGAAWRGLFGVAAGAIVVAQLVVDGADTALLPLHAVAAITVALVPWERPHPEAAPLRMGRRRRRSALPWPRAVLLLAALAAALAYAVTS